MNATRWEVIRCNGEIERRLGFRFVLHDRRTALIRGGADTRRGCTYIADQLEDEERRPKRRKV